MARLATTPSVTLHFMGLSPAQHVTLGPAPWFRVSGNFVRQGPDGRIVATYKRHQWLAGEGHFARYECRDRCVLHFEDVHGGASEPFGPFTFLHAADGAVYAERQNLLAKFIEEVQLWHCFITETFWPTLALTPAPASQPPMER